MIDILAYIANHPKDTLLPISSSIGGCDELLISQIDQETYLSNVYQAMYSNSIRSMDTVRIVSGKIMFLSLVGHPQHRVSNPALLAACMMSAKLHTTYKGLSTAQCELLDAAGMWFTIQLARDRSYEPMLLLYKGWYTNRSNKMKYLLSITWSCSWIEHIRQGMVFDNRTPYYMDMSIGRIIDIANSVCDGNLSSTIIYDYFDVLNLWWNELSTWLSGVSRIDRRKLMHHVAF